MGACIAFWGFPVSSGQIKVVIVSKIVSGGVVVLQGTHLSQRWFRSKFFLANYESFGKGAWKIINQNMALISNLYDL